jgi:hypothetical protein
MAKFSNNQVSLSPELKLELTKVADQLGLGHPGIIIRMVWKIYGDDFLQRFSTYYKEVVVPTSEYQSLQSLVTEKYKEVVETTRDYGEVVETTSDNNSESTESNEPNILDLIRNS